MSSRIMSRIVMSPLIFHCINSLIFSHDTLEIKCVDTSPFIQLILLSKIHFGMQPDCQKILHHNFTHEQFIILPVAVLYNNKLF